MDAEKSWNAVCDISNLHLREQFRKAGPEVVIGSGKTTIRCRLQLALEDRKRVTVSGSQAIDKHSIKLATFIAALFYCLSTEVQVRTPTWGDAG
jgi:type II secretory pathway predicted ATPase ExeA